MSDLRDALERAERATGPATLPPDSFRRLVAFRDRRRRNQRIGAAMLSLVVAIAAVGIVLRAFRNGDDPRQPRPAGPPSVTSVIQFGTAGIDEVWSVATDASAVYLAGDTEGELATSAGGVDAFARAYAPDGGELWIDQFGTAKDDYAFANAVDASGVYISGRTGGALLPDGSMGGDDAFVRAYDPDGTVRWTRQFGTAEDDSGISLTVGPGGVYVAGSTAGALPGAEGSGEGFLAAFDADGTQLWIRQFTDAAYITSADATGIYVGGGGFVSKFDFAGRQQWTDEVRADAGEGIGATVVGLAADGRGVYAAGNVVGDLRGKTSEGSNDAFVRRYGADGTVAWTEQFGTKRSDRAAGIVLDGDGVIVSGDTDGILEGASAGAFDVFVRRLHADGSVDWTVQFGTSFDQRDPWIAATPSGVVMSGNTERAFPGETQVGELDAFLAYLEFGTPPPSG